MHGAVKKSKIWIVLLLMLFVSLAAACGQTNDEELVTVPEVFMPDTVQVNMSLSAFYCQPSEDGETVGRLYELYSGMVLMDEELSPDLTWSIQVTFTYSADGEETLWSVCRDGTCAVDGGKYYQMMNGEEIYTQVKAEYDRLRDVEQFAQTLYSLKNDYIGDASADEAILSALGVSETIGTYTIELQTNTAPFGVTVHVMLEDASLPVTDVDTVMGRYGYLFLSLVDNAERFAWDYETASGVHSGSVLAGTYDVKQYGESLEQFAQLCGIIDSLSASDGHPEDVSLSSGGSSYVMRGAKADTVSGLWEMVQSLQLEESTVEPEGSEALNVMFYDSKGNVISAWSFFGEYCRKDGQTEYYHITENAPNLQSIRYIYESSKDSPDYVDGVYINSVIFESAQKEESEGSSD